MVLGDFNTWTGKDVDSTAKIFTDARFSTPFVNGLPTWKTFIIELKLDWHWLRGLQPINYGIDRKIGLSVTGRCGSKSSFEIGEGRVCSPLGTRGLLVVWCCSLQGDYFKRTHTTHPSKEPIN